MQKTLSTIDKATMSKPVLTFVKMMGCGPCNNFFGNPDPEKSQWAQLVKDKELAKIVEFSLAEWGFDRQTGSQFKKPDHLGFVNYGPAFVLVDSGNKQVHVEYDKNLPKTASGIKKWVLENHKKFKITSVSAPAAKAPVAKPQVATKAISAPVTKVGAPRAFVSQDRLPQELRTKAISAPATQEQLRFAAENPRVASSSVPTPQIQVATPQVVQAPPAKPQVKTAPGLRIVPRNSRLNGRRR